MKILKSAKHAQPSLPAYPGPLFRYQVLCEHPPIILRSAFWYVDFSCPPKQFCWATFIYTIYLLSSRKIKFVNKLCMYQLQRCYKSLIANIYFNFNIIIMMW